MASDRRLPKRCVCRRLLNDCARMRRIALRRVVDNQPIMCRTRAIASTPHLFLGCVAFYYPLLSISLLRFHGVCVLFYPISIILTQHMRALVASQQNTSHPLVQRSSRSSPRPSRMGASPPLSRFDPSRSASPSPAPRTARSFPTVPSAAASPTS